MIASIPNAHARTINSLAFRPGTGELASASDDGTIGVWSLQARRKVGRDLDVAGNDKGVWQIAFTPDGKNLVSGCDDRRMHAWDVESHLEVGAPSVHQGSIWSLDIARDGREVASGASDGTVHLFEAGGVGNAFRLRETLLLRVTDGPVWWVTFDRTPQRPLRVAIGSTDRAIRIVDIARLEALFADPGLMEREAAFESGLSVVSDDPRTGIVPMTASRWSGSGGR